MLKDPKFAPLALLMIMQPIYAQQQASLRISTTVPPPPCQHPDPCATVSSPPGVKTVAVIEGDSVRYIGTTPAVTRDGEYLVVKF